LPLFGSSKLILLSLISLICVILNVNGQYSDWSCDNSYGIPIGVCFASILGYAFEYDCNGTETLTTIVYDGDDCSGDSTSSSLNIGSDTSIVCDTGNTCGYIEVAIYTNDDCTGSYYSSVLVTDECYGFLEYSCSGTDVTTTTYSTNGCEDELSSGTVDYEEYYNSYFSYLGGCFGVTCVGGGGSSANTQSIFSSMFIVAIAVLAKLF